jgi:hypothetical protein
MGCKDTTEYRSTFLPFAQRASSSPCHAWRYIPGPIGPQGEADMQAQSERIDVDVEIPGRE